jgi:hypothetical protein
MKIQEVIVNEDIEIGDSFDIELGNIVIETGVVGFMHDGIIVEGDEKTLALLGVSGALLEGVNNYMDTDPASVTANKAKEFDQAAKQAFKPDTPGYFDDEDPNPKKIPQSQHWADPNPNVQKTVQNYMNRNYMDSKPAAGAQGTQESKIKNEAKYHGREVPLGKKMAGDVKKSKVYVRGPKGNVVKVNFGDKKMRIKKSNPKRRRSFRARHNCANPGPRWKARYWSCRSW